MEFPQLARGRLIRRYKRFFADVRLDDGAEVTAHAPNPGAMLGLSEPGAVCWLSPAAGAGRKLAWRLELVEAHGAPVLVNTQRPNALAAEAVAEGRIPELAGYAEVRREVRYGDGCRIDLLLATPGRPPAFVEVKSVTLSRQAGLAEWPDCVSARGARHVRSLAEEVGRSARAVVLFLIGRGDCDRFTLAADIDPGFAAALAEAERAGVEVLAYRCAVSPAGATVSARLPVSGSRA